MNQSIKETIKDIPKQIIKNPGINDISGIFNKIRTLLISKEWLIFQGIQEGFNRLVLLYTSNYFSDAIKLFVFESGKNRHIIALAKKNELYLSYFINKLNYPDDIIKNAYLLDFEDSRGIEIKTGIHHANNVDEILKFLFQFEKQTLIMLNLIPSNLKSIQENGMLKLTK